MIDSFQGKYRFLSNFHPVEVTFEGMTFPSTENAYQAAKCADVDEREVFQFITPGQAKKLGREVELRSDWNDVNLNIMYELNLQKFSDPDLKKLLLETHPEGIVEGNTWGDTFWGVCDGKGENHLGRILMRIRNELMEK